CAEALKKADLSASVEPLVRAARAHPELTAEVVEALGYGPQVRGKAVGHLRAFFGHADPEVRARALAGLCSAEPEGADKELRAGLQDASSVVRRAAAAQVFTRLEQKRSELKATAQQMQPRAPPPPPAGVVEGLVRFLTAEKPPPPPAPATD